MNVYGSDNLPIFSDWNGRLRPGVYALTLGGAIVYIGQSSNVSARIGAHQRNGVKFDGVGFVDCNHKSRRLWLETRLIMKHRPLLNIAKTRVGFKKLSVLVPRKSLTAIKRFAKREGITLDRAVAMAIEETILPSKHLVNAE